MIVNEYWLYFYHGANRSLHPTAVALWCRRKFPQLHSYNLNTIKEIAISEIDV